MAKALFWVNLYIQTQTEELEEEIEVERVAGSKMEKQSSYLSREL